jgi:hypothetical protein
VIVFGAAIGDPEPYSRYAAAGLRFAEEPGSELYAFAAVGPIARTYNLLLERAAARTDLEALVLVDAHVEIVDPDFCGKVRRALGDPDVAVVGAAGAKGSRSIAWWEGEVSAAPVIHRYGEYGGGELSAYSWTKAAPAPAEVDSVDGALLVLSPWAVRSLHFDESLRSHGYDVDFCLRARRAGRKVMTADLRIVQHRSLELIGDVDLWVETHIQTAERWDPEEPNEAAWKRRARRAEAERECARAIAYSNGLAWDARVLELERAIERATRTWSWRLTRPLREANRVRRHATRGLRRR